LSENGVFQEIRIVTAKELTPERIAVIAQRFTEHFHISGYSVKQERDASLIDGFVIFASGYRYDYSVKGQLKRIATYLKNDRENDQSAPISDETAPVKIRRSIDAALSEFSEDPAALFGMDSFWDVDASEVVEESNNDIAEQIKNGKVSPSVREHMLDGFAQASTIEEIGQVASVSDGVAMVTGIDKCVASELIRFSNETYGIAMNLEPSKVGVVLLGDASGVVEGTLCKRTGKPVSIPVGRNMLGRVVDPLGNPIDGKGIIRTSETRPIEYEAPGIIDRSPVNRPLQTGITAIDAMTPIGRGQRELLIGDRQTGKTAIAIDTIINQRGKNVLCVYVAIGQKMSTIVQVVNTLEKHNALSYTVVVAASASDQASLQYIAPYAGCAIAEEFMYNDHDDVLIIYDDLTKHAQAYRAISLLLRRPPGREAYPGDVFYLHSRLLERAAKLEESRGGSITAIPIIETLGGDISAYIPTNVISITDGQIYLESELFFSGQRPAINVGLSVSRVGGAAQTKAMKKVAGPLRISLAQAREMAAFAQFGSDLDENTRKQLKRGIVLNEVLKQEQYSALQMEEQVAILYLATSEKLSFLEREDVKEYALEFLRRIRALHPEVLDKISNDLVFDDESKAQIDKLEEEYHSVFLAEHPEYEEET